MASSFAWAIVLYFLLVTRAAQRGMYFVCYNEADRGISYQGTESVTESGSRCAESSHNGTGLCRNPDLSLDKPWCVSGNGNVKEACNVDKCDGLPIDLSAVNVTSSQVSVEQKVRLSPALATNGQLGQDITNCFLSTLNGIPSWWQADLVVETVVTGIGWNLQRDAVYRMTKINMLVGSISDSSNGGISFKLCGRVVFEMESATSTIYRKCGKDGIEGRYVRIQSAQDKVSGRSSLLLCEVQINSGSPPASSCRYDQIAVKQQQRFTARPHEQILEVQCNDGYWPRSKQKIECLPSGYWSGFDCQKAEKLNWNDVKATVDVSPKALSKGARETPGSNAINGIIPTNTSAGSGLYDCFSTLKTSHKRSLRITMPTDYLIVSVKVYLRDNDELHNRQSWQDGMQIKVIHRNGTELMCGHVYNSSIHGQSPTVFCKDGIVARSILIQRENNDNELQFCEVEVFAITECGKPPTIQHADITFPGNALNTEAIYRCQTGYLPSSPQKMACLSNATWSHSRPSCHALSCTKAPATILHTSAVTSDLAKTTYDSIVRYACDSGYEREGDRVLRCNFEAQWEGYIKCRAITCSKIPLLENGTVTGNHTFVSFSCYHGYRLVNSRQASCKSRDGWLYLNGQPKCEVMNCSELVRPPNAKVVVFGLSVNSTIKYRCKRAYSLEGPEQRTCHIDSKASAPYWDPSEIKSPTFCERERKCERPKKLMNGQKTVNSFAIGGNVTYKCHTGFTISGNVTRFCTRNLTWTGKAPTCKQIQCKHTATTGNVYRFGNRRRYNDTVVYSCSLGYILIGNKTSKCMQNQEWSSPPPRCQVLNCSRPQKPENGDVKVTSTNVNSTAVYSCDKGYVLNGTEDSICRPNSNGDGAIWDVRTCQPKQCNLFRENSLRNGSVLDNRNYYLDKVQFICDRGHRLQGGGQVWQCNHEGQWVDTDAKSSYKFPTCEPVFCDRPGESGNVEVLGKYFHFPGKVKFSCKSGYCLQGLTEAQCNSNGKWSSPYPTCSPVTCPQLHLSSHMDVSMDPADRTLGAVATYTCDKGYEIRSDVKGRSFTRTCVQNTTVSVSDCVGRWSGSHPKCLAIRCNAPLHPTNGTVAGEEFVYPKLIRFECNPGFDIVGQESFLCNHQGKWRSVAHPHNESTFPSCKPKFCGNPPALRNSDIVGDDYHFPSHVTYKCQLGFCFTGTGRARCLANGTWSQEPRICRRVWCGNLDHPQNGTVLVPDRRIEGEAANYRCDRGFILNGPSSRVCTHSGDQTECGGKWSGIAPMCKPKACLKVISNQLVNGAVIGDKFFYPEIVHFICKEGHTLQGGGSKWQCNDNGNWTDMTNNSLVDFPTCEPKDCGHLLKPPHCGVVGKNYHFLGVVNFTRDRGYCIDGATHLTCTSNGTWSKESTTCKPILCPLLYRRPHARISFSSASMKEGSLVDTRATYTCEDGYDLNMNSTFLSFTRQCRQFHDITRCDGYWSGTEPCCLPRSCPDPHNSNFRNGTIAGRNYFYPQIISLNCYMGHELRGGGSVFRCNQTGHWVEVKLPGVDAHDMAEQRVGNSLRRAEKCLGARAILEVPQMTKIPTLPTCEPKGCGKPNINKNCRSTGNYFQYAGVVAFTADHGYCVHGAVKLVCNSSGLWSSDSPTCKRVQCTALEPPSHSKIEVVSTSRYVDDAAKYTCEPGYDLNMDKRLQSFARQCVQPGENQQCTGFWSEVEPCCIPRSCPYPNSSNFRNGTISGKAFFYPETIRLDCNVGHELVGGGPLFQCSQDGRWVEIDKLPTTNQQEISHRIKRELDNVRNCLTTNQIVTKHHQSAIPQFPTCQPRNCGIPTVKPNCNILGNYFQYPGVVSFAGDHGYCVDGPSQHSCNSSGLWSKVSPTCRRVECPTLNPPSHGKIVLISKSKYIDDAAHYTCEPGYDLNVDRTLLSFERRCSQTVDIHQCTGIWSDLEPCCIPRSCPDPRLSNFRNGTISGKSFFHPETIRLDCVVGHELVGGGSLFQCSQDGFWVQIDQLPGTNQEQIDHRIKLALDNVRNCLKTNRIVTKHLYAAIPQFPNCQPKNCGKPTVNPNCNVEGDYFQYPGVVSFTGVHGYCVHGATQLVCNSSGLWSRDSPTCKRVQCAALEPPSHSEIELVSKSRYVDDAAKYTCEPGYDLNMDRRLRSFARQCIQPGNIQQCTGYWSHVEPCCIPRSCPDPSSSNFRNGTISWKAFFYPETIRLDCNVGHELVGGRPLFQCSQDGRWVEIDKLPTTNQQEITHRLETELDNVRNCLKTNQIVTIHHQSAIRQFPTCQPRNCGNPTVKPNCNVVGNYFQYPGVVSFAGSHGYCVDGASQHSCNSSGLWSKLSPTCRQVECPTLNPPSHGKIVLISNSKYVDDVANYTCEPGYDLNMDRTLLSFVRRCSQSRDIHNCTGIWRDVEPCCIPRSCPDPILSKFLNGTISGKSFFHPETIRLNCVVGHELVGGGPLFQCSQYGRWVQIDKLPAANQQEIDQRIKTELDNVRNCLKTNQIVTKHLYAAISQFPTCQPMNCGKPTVNHNCNVEGKYFQYPGVVAFTGYHGYCVHGAAQLVCNSSGLWSRDSPTCKRVLCTALEPPSHSKIEVVSKSRYVDDAANYTCEPGFDLNMDKRLLSFARQCVQPEENKQCTGFWSEVEPCCIPRSCPDPNSSNFRNGTISGNAFFFPETIRLDCNAGHELVGGGPLFQCSQDGRWVEIDKLPTTNQKEITHRIKTELDNVRNCLQTNQIVTIHHQSAIRQFPTCQPRNCGKPTVEPSCTIDPKYFQYPGVVRFNREKYGYCVDGAIETRCTESGSWSNKSPTCRKIQCSPLAAPRNGLLSISQERHVGDRATYTCNKGYKLNLGRRISLFTRVCYQGENIQQCNGSWGKSEPCCIARSCPDPNQRPFANGTIVGQHYFYPEMISLNCIDGHVLARGGPVYRCNEKGSWVHAPIPGNTSGQDVKSRAKTELDHMKNCGTKVPPHNSKPINPFPTCEPVKCPIPAVPANGKRIGVYFQFPGVVKFKCRRGFYLKGETQIDCLATGEWSHNPPECKPIQCPTLPNDTCMYVLAPNRSVDEEGRYFPGPGHYLTGDRIRICNQTEPTSDPVGHWTGVPPECKKKDCKEPLSIQNGGYRKLNKTESTLFFSRVRYYCSLGYEIKDGDANRKCTETGLWSGLLPRCQHVCAEAEHRTSSAEHCVVKEDGKSELSCLGKTACPSDFTPVCASDTNTYNNRCRMKIASCGISGRHDNEVASHGQCSFGGICLESRPKPLAGVKCRGAYYRYYHNSESGKCEQYVHGSCFEGRNVFYAKDDCQETCVKYNPCFLDLDPGVCGLNEERFYYNVTEEKCMKFNYTGCFGNENNFPTKSKCEMRCNGTRVTPAPVVKTPEECCPPVLKKRCIADLVVDVDAKLPQKLGHGRVSVRVKTAPKSLGGQTLQKYRDVIKLSLPAQESTVDGCSMVCPHFRQNTKYLVLVREVQRNSKMLSAEKYRLIPYSSGEKSQLFDGLRNCKN